MDSELRVDDPRPGETGRQYIDRMLGAPGSAERNLADDSTYRYYLSLWDAFQRKNLTRGEKWTYY